MRRFTALFMALDATTSTREKIAALAAYFRTAPPHDVAWAVYFLTGRKLKRLVGSRDLREAAIAAAGIPPWLFESSYEAVGDLAETIALLLPPPAAVDAADLATWVEQELAPLAGLASEDVQARLASAWQRLDRDERFVFGKLITGAFRVGTARQLVYRALAEATGVAAADVAHRLIGEWAPSPQFFDRLRAEVAATVAHRPYPFFLAYPLEDDPAALGAIADWQAEWKWDGIRAQIVRRDDGASVWSRGEELVNDAFPELVAAAQALAPGTVIDGEILAWSPGEGTPLPFARLQRRLNRKAPAAKLLRDTPVVMLAYDLLEHAGVDVRGRPLRERRATLEALLPGGTPLRVSPRLDAADWTALAAARDRARAERAEGLMLKRLDAPYGVGRVRGPWWKWKVEPYTIDAVMVYAQAGHGRRASLYTDYTFALWHDGELVPFAKAYSGLTDEEIRTVDAWIRAHTVERFGPVRRVEPTQVFELAFEAIQASSRHKSGVAVRFPRILRRRTDKPAAEADTLATLNALATSPAPAPGGSKHRSVTPAAARYWRAIVARLERSRHSARAPASAATGAARTHTDQAVPASVFKPMHARHIGRRHPPSPATSAPSTSFRRDRTASFAAVPSALELGIVEAPVCESRLACRFLGSKRCCRPSDAGTAPGHVTEGLRRDGRGSPAAVSLGSPARDRALRYATRRRSASAPPRPRGRAAAKVLQVSGTGRRPLRCPSSRAAGGGRRRPFFLPRRESREPALLPAWNSLEHGSLASVA